MNFPALCIKQFAKSAPLQWTNQAGKDPADSSNFECTADPMNITASVFINDDESGLHHDYEEWLEKIGPP